MINQIPNNWQKVKLGDLAKFSNGRSIKLGNRGAYPIYGSNGLIGRTDKYNYENGVVIGRVGAYCGSLSYEENRFWATDNTIVSQLRNEHNNYLYYLLKTLRLNKRAGGSAQPLLTQDLLNGIEVNSPKDYIEQEKIALSLSALDDKIELNNKIAKTLEEMAQAIFKEWFVKKGDGDWEIKKIKDIAKINKGISYSSKEISNSEGLPMINLANFLRGGGFNAEGVKFYTGKYKQSNIVKSGDIVIAMTDLTSNREVIGHPARVPSYSHWDKILVSLDVCSVETEDIYIEFLYYLMLRKDFSYLMASSAGGTNVAHLSQKFIETYEFALPDKKTLEKFRSNISPIFKKINLIEVENQRLTRMRDLLLPKLMRGEIKV